MHTCSMSVKGVKKTDRQYDTVNGPEEPVDLIFALIKPAQRVSSDQPTKAIRTTLVLHCEGVT